MEARIVNRSQSRQKDTIEKREMCDVYIKPMRCLGQHLVHPAECCWLCKSSDPSNICHKEMIRESGDFTHEAENMIENYKVVE